MMNNERDQFSMQSNSNRQDSNAIQYTQDLPDPNALLFAQKNKNLDKESKIIQLIVKNNPNIETEKSEQITQKAETKIIKNLYENTNESKLSNDTGRRINE